MGATAAIIAASCCCDGGDPGDYCGCPSSVLVTWTGQVKVGWECDESCLGFPEDYTFANLASAMVNATEVDILLTPGLTPWGCGCGYSGWSQVTAPLLNCLGADSGKLLKVRFTAYACHNFIHPAVPNWNIRIDVHVAVGSETSDDHSWVYCTYFNGLSSWMFSATTDEDCITDGTYAPNPDFSPCDLSGVVDPPPHCGDIDLIITYGLGTPKLFAMDSGSIAVT